MTLFCTDWASLNVLASPSICTVGMGTALSPVNHGRWLRHVPPESRDIIVEFSVTF